MERSAEVEALRVASRLLTLAEGPTNSPATWQGVCSFLGILYVPFYGPRQATGEYVRYDEPAHAAIALNANLQPEHQCRVWLHELSHHLLFESAPQLIFDPPLIHRYDDEHGGLAHRIACRVERLVSG